MKLRCFVPLKSTGTQNDKFHFFRSLPDAEQLPFPLPGLCFRNFH